MFMAGYIGHIIHGYETFEYLSDETKSKMSIWALRSFLIGEIVPDLATEKKALTHFYRGHPIYGKSYQIPDMEKVEKLFLKKDPTYLGVFAHLMCDKEIVERFWLVYSKPYNDLYELYKFYDKFNYKIIVEFMPKLNKTFGTNFSDDVSGFLALVELLFQNNIPMTGILEMDNYRYTSNIHKILKNILAFGNYYGNDDSKFSANIDDYLRIIDESAAELAKKIDNLYAS